MLSGIFTRNEFRDPDLADILITVTEVRMSPDLKHATAFVTRLGRTDIEAKLPALRARRRTFVRSWPTRCGCAWRRMCRSRPIRRWNMRCTSTSSCARLRWLKDLEVEK